MANTFYKHIIVVHGIGEQQLNETGVNFMNALCRALPAESGSLTVINLVSRVTDFLVKGASEPAYVVFETANGNRYFIGFSEVYWQPVTKSYLAAHDDHLAVPIFTWAHSINSRIRGRDRARQSLSAWREAIDNAETLLGLVDKLAVISKNSDLFARILRNFLGDVQMYAEVDPVHSAVNGVFRDALDEIAVTQKKIGQEFDSSEIYIVAHSEGTVVSWKSLMLAASEARPPDWLGQIRGLVTLGSPIDKHRLVWGRQNFPADVGAWRETKIPWWNFWDYSDPVGHSLDGIFQPPGAAKNNQFERRFDAGFCRYPIPGLAHVGYWKDVNLHHRIIQEVMQIPAGYQPWQMKTGNRWWGHWWALRSADFVSYGLGRAAEAGAAVYFLNRLLGPVRGKLVQMAPALGRFLDRAKTWPLPFDSVPGWRWLNLAVWILVPAAIWKLLWDVALFDVQDRKLNLGAQERVERVAMAAWMAVLVFAALDLQITQSCGQDCVTLKDRLGWAVGLLVTVLIWKLHTTVHKGLIQLWRYGKGATAFQPSPGETRPVTGESPAPGAG